jgi:hypothetical protein
VAWKTDGGAVSGPFQANTAYTAEVRLHSLEGHTFTGTVYRYGEREMSPLPGGTEKRVTLEIDGLQTGEAPGGGPQATEDAPVMVTSLDLTGKVPAPVSGGFPAAALAAGEYIGIVEWKPDVFGSFAGNTAYTAQVTLYPLAGYTFEGIPAKPGAAAVTGAFSHSLSGSVIHGAGEAGKPLAITVSFPPTANDRVINIDTVADGDSGPGWSFAGGVLTIKKNDTYIIEGDPETTANRVVVAPYTTATVVLEAGVDIVSTECAFDMTGATVELILAADDTVLTSGSGAGIHAPAGSTLVITGSAGADGKLTVTGGGNGAGIGGGDGEDGGEITIRGGTVNATCQPGGRSAAIGGGGNGNGGRITITGGFVRAYSPYSEGENAAIGGGSNGNAGVITISDGVVIAVTGSPGAAIGGGRMAVFGSITISGGTIIAFHPDVASLAYPIDHTVKDQTNWGTIGFDSGKKTAGELSYGIPGGGGFDQDFYGYTDTTIIDDNTPPVIFAYGIQQGLGKVHNRMDSALSKGIAARPKSALMTMTGTWPDIEGTITLQNTTGLGVADAGATAFEVPAGATLTVPEGWTLVIGNGNKLSNHGKIINNGVIKKNGGTYEGETEFHGRGSGEYTGPDPIE